MKGNTFYYLFIMVSVLACSKSEPKSYEYWNDLVHKKYAEIATLTQSVPCSDIDEFEILGNDHNFYPVHPSVRRDYDRLQGELEKLEREMELAASGKDVVRDQSLLPNPPVRKVCENGKPLLLYAHDLSLEEVKTELTGRYSEIRDFYKNVSCTDAYQWTGRYILSKNCTFEPFAVHRTIGNREMNTKLDVYNMLMIRKMSLEKQQCGSGFQAEKLIEKVAVRCENGKPVVITE